MSHKIDPLIDEQDVFRLCLRAGLTTAALPATTDEWRPFAELAMLLDDEIQGVLIERQAEEFRKWRAEDEARQSECSP